MKTSSTGKRKSTSAARSESDYAQKVAFQELVDRSEAEWQEFKEKKRAEQYASWRGAAGRFKGLSDALAARIALRNIKRTVSGYGVRMMRDGEVFSRHFNDLSDDGLAAAVQFRDEAVKILGEARAHDVPEHVLNALGLSAPVIGIFREQANSSYNVSFKNAKGATTTRAFPFLYVAEEDAYAKAIEFLEGTLKPRSQNGRGKKGA